MLTAMVAVAMAGLAVDAKALVAASWAKTHVVGHRGAAAYVPENTLDSFRRAVTDGAHASECDVHMSSDGVAMVIHDKTLDRTTSLKGAVAETSSGMMKGAAVPTLEEYIDVLKGKIVQVIEIKDGAGVVPAVVKAVRAKKTETETIIFSFNADYVKEAKTLAPEIFAVWLVAAPYQEAAFPKLMELKSEAKADALGFQFRNVSAPLAAFLRKSEVPLFVWTVPPGDEVSRLQGLRVNFIITDHPGDVLRQLGS